MKKFLFLFASMLCLIACGSEENLSFEDSNHENGSRSTEDSSFPGNQPTSNINAFDVFGKVHNIMLHNGVQTFDEETISEFEGATKYDQLTAFNIAYVPSLPLHSVDKQVIIECLPDYKHLFNEETTWDLLTKESSVTTPKTKADVFNMSFQDLYTHALNLDMIDSKEYDMLLLLADYSKENATGLLSSYELENKVDDLINLWLEAYGDVDYSSIIPSEQNGVYGQIPAIDLKDFPEGAISGLVLNISKHSLVYWNGPMSPARPERVAPWVAADAGGALIGAGGALLYHWISNTSVDWASVGYSAAVGAIDGSLGISGKIGRWLFSI
ncbi:MAG: hypothetical protein K2L26_04380 [Duncaniella sp.]|nr:hypothetical protein [Duncaniella sp.]MDE6390637.1 hypothetical protein [Duncaniella sp.]